MFETTMPWEQRAASGGEQERGESARTFQSLRTARKNPVPATVVRIWIRTETGERERGKIPSRERAYAYHGILLYKSVILNIYVFINTRAVYKKYYSITNIGKG